MGANRTSFPPLLPLSIMASIIRGALRSGDAVAYFDATVAAFRMFGRDEDATAVADMRELYVMGEIETLMTLRAQWLGRR